MEDEKDVLNKMIAIIHEKMGGLYSDKVIEYGMFPQDFGSMENADGYAIIAGECGDTNEIFIRIKGERIGEVKFATDGCVFAIATCQAAARMATGRTLRECLRITQKTILEHLGGLPRDHEHCALLAAMTFQKALRNYVVKGRWLVHHRT